MAAATSNTVLTLDQITREALRVLHQKLNFIGNMNRDYDDSFAKKGAKIGDALRIRLPNQYTVSSGAALALQDVIEDKVSLTINNQHHVDLQFTAADLTLKIDDFSERFIKPAMAVLAAKIEALVFADLLLKVPNVVDNSGSAFTLARSLQARKVLTDNLAPNDNRTFILDTQANVDLLTDVKGLFNSQEVLSKAYKEGIIGRTAGFDWYENTLLPRFTSGSSTTNTISGAVTANGSTSLVTGTAVTFKKGDVFTVGSAGTGTFQVHPESKDTTSTLQQFTVTADVTAGTTVNFWPPIYTSGGRQNVNSSGIQNGATLTKVGSASEVFAPSLAFHKDAFTFATADLQMPDGVDMASRQTYDGISMRLVRQYDINYDTFPCRLDVLWGAAAVRPQLACRVYNNS